MKKKDCTIPAAKTKVLISCAVTVQLICVFVFAYANCWFSHAAAQIYTTTLKIIGLNNVSQTLHGHNEVILLPSLSFLTWVTHSPTVSLCLAESHLSPCESYHLVLSRLCL